MESIHIKLLGLIAAVIAIGLYFSVSDRMPPMPYDGIEAHAKEAPLSKAQATIKVSDLKLDGNIVFFTIPEDARAQDEKADKVVISGLYAIDKRNVKKDQCPVLPSSAVSKDVQDYDMMSGRARVKAVFDKEDAARQVYDKGCLLIRDE